MTTPRRIVLTLSPELFTQLEARAAEGRLDAREWALRALQTAVSHPESKAARERRRREAGFTLLSLLARRQAGEGRPHAPNP